MSGQRRACVDSFESGTNRIGEAFSDGRFFRIDSFLKGSNRIDVGVSWSPLFFATGSVVNLYGRAGSLTNESELVATGEIGSLTLTNLFLSVETPFAQTNAAFFRLSSPCDADGDGVPDWFELGEFGGDPNRADTDGDGFPDSAELVLNTNPSDDEVPSVEVVSANMSRCELTGAFAADSTNGLSGAVFCRTIPMPRSSTWTQYFLTAGTGSAGLSGLRISYWDQNGHTGTVEAVNFGDGVRLADLSPSLAGVTVSLRATSNVLSSAGLTLVSYRPEIVLSDAQVVSSNGLRSPDVLVLTDPKTEVWYDYSGRPTSEPISDEEEYSNPFSGISGLSYDAVRHVLSIEHPGVYRMPDGRDLIALDPSVTFGYGHEFVGTRATYDRFGEDYDVEDPYPIDTPCIYESWFEGVCQERGCTCQAEVTTGLEGYGGDPRVSQEVTEEEGRRARGVVRVNRTVVWRGEASHERGAVWKRWHRFLTLDPCTGCARGCADGDCDDLEKPSLGSVRFRIPLGNPEAAHISGFLYFKREDPFVVRAADFVLLARADAEIEDETDDDGVRVVTCLDNRGRTVRVTDVAGGVDIVIFDCNGSLEHTWHITTADGAMRFRKISRADNVMLDRTYSRVDGVLTETDNLSGLATTLVKTGSVNAPGGFTEETVVRDGGRIVSDVWTRSGLVGTGEDAVLREFEARTLSAGGAWRVSHAAYWDDPDHPRRHGAPKLEWGDDRDWRYCAYDDEGRETFCLDQRNGSPVVDADGGWSLENLPAVDAFATVSDYTPHAGDDGDEKDADKVRTESRYVVRSGEAILVGRIWYTYARGWGGTVGPAVTRTAIRAATPVSGIDDPDNAVSSETRYDDESWDVPYLLRGELDSSVGEDGVETWYDRMDCGDRWRLVERRTLGDATAKTCRVTETDAVYGNLLYEATALAADGTEFGWKNHTYDDKNRRILTQYDDGSFETNAYSCCRLLWTIDRNGAKTLRSATTGTDHLYYAEEEVYIVDLPQDVYFRPDTWNYKHYTNAFRVTKHFFDALGRETNTTQCSSFHPGYSVDPSHKWNNYGIDASATTVYPDGVSDYSIACDVSGLVTETLSASTGESEWHEQTLWDSDCSADDPIRRTVTATYRGGGSVERTEHDGVWREVSRYDDYGSDGLRSGYEIAEDSDGNRVTNRIDRYDFLGRLVASVAPLSVVSNVYDGASDRAVATVDLVSGRATTNLYDAVGESVGSLSDGIERRSETSYELDGGELWRVESDVVSSGSVTASCTIVRTRLTGLSDGLRSETVRETDGTVVETTRSTFDPATSVLTETVTSMTEGERTVRSLYGREIETVGQEGRIFYYYDPYGRIYFSRRSARDGSHLDLYRGYFRDAADRLTHWRECWDYTSTAVCKTDFGYDARGNEVWTSGPIGDEVQRIYDGADNLVGVFGDTYELAYGYDAAGRRTSLETTRDGETFDRTSWEYDPQTALCLAKEYADGSRVEYDYAPDGLPLRTDLPNGHWIGFRYDSQRRKVADESDDLACTADYSYDVFGRLVSAESPAADYAYELNGRGIATNETATVGGVLREIRRVSDQYGRQVGFAASGCAVTSYAYSPDGLLSVVSNGDVAVEYRYDYLSADVGYDLTLPNGVRFERALTRHNCLHSRVLSVVNRTTLSTNELAYTYDKLHRPTVRNADRFAYNRRGEVVSATVAGEASDYAYDGIGNFTTVTGGTVTNSYVANELNQYEEVASGDTTVEPTYTSNGELASFGQWTYAYDALSRLTAAYSNGTLVVSNRYDHLGRRVQKIAPDGTHTFLYDGWRPVVEIVTSPGGGKDRIEYYWGKDLSGTLDGAAGVGGLLYVKRNGAIYVPFYDAFGNVMGYWGSNGAVVAEYAYDAFGRTVAKSGIMTDIFSIRYSTKYYDAETGMYYYGKRFYMTSLCRWLTRDPIEESDGGNLYCACQNDLVSSIDVLGLRRWILFYYSRVEYMAFRAAAETEKRHIESSGDFDSKCDKVIMKGVLTSADFASQWAAAKKETDGADRQLEINVVHLYTHSARGMLHFRDASMTSDAIITLPRLNWSDGAQIVCHGCNSGLPSRKQVSVAEAFAKGQGVVGVGQSGFSQFSTSPLKRSWFTRVGSLSLDVYLWSYGDGGQFHTFGDRRTPNMYGQGWEVVP